MLNYFTLRITDQEIALKVRERQTTNFAKCFWPCNLLILINMIIHILMWYLGREPLHSAVISSIFFIE